MSTANETISAVAADCSPGCTGPICLVLGILLDVIGSVGINIGQNLQAMALSAGGKPGTSKLWNFGLLLFLSSTLLALGALSLAPASILVPIESVQFVSNAVFGRVVRKRTITPKMMVGTASIILGIALVIIFGTDHDAKVACYTEASLIKKWQRPEWWGFLIVCASLSLASYVVWRVYRKAGASLPPRRLPLHQWVEPIAFTIAAALFGGGQVVAHAKVLAELVEMSAATGQAALADWFFWVEVCVLLVFGVYWLVRLSQCLGLYDPLFIIPLMQTCFIIFGLIAAGIFVQEFDHMATSEFGAAAWPCYVLGILMAVAGLYLIAPPQMDLALDSSTRANPAEVQVVHGEREGEEALAPAHMDLVIDLTHTRPADVKVQPVVHDLSSHGEGAWNVGDSRMFER